MEQEKLEIKQVMVLRDVKVLKALFSKWRSEILRFLSSNEYTVKQLSDMLGINPGTVYHHVKELQKAGLVVETRTVQEKNIVSRYYRAVAREFRVDFSIITSEDDKDVTQWVRSRVISLIDALKAYNIDIPEESYPEAEDHITEFINLENLIKEKIIPKNPELLKNTASSTAKDVFSLLSLLRLSQNKDYVETKKKLLDFLKKYEMT
ncbi:MAG: winged helix-turn-helix transcriptional regulator [Candidatus Lokiarchaeota archaeon]|nr:winged helix-turn-helix transcriptional regulator [Candidatus Lokiarchaeota archaeon]